MEVSEMDLRGVGRGELEQNALYTYVKFLKDK